MQVGYSSPVTGARGGLGTENRRVVEKLGVAESRVVW
jgi:hypothetical protein